MLWLLTRGRVPYLIVLLLGTAWLASHAARVGVEKNNESLNTRDAAQDTTYERFKATFGSDEDLILAVTHPHLLGSDGLRLVDELTRRIAAIDGVRHVYSLTNSKQLVSGEAGVEEAPLLPRPLDAPGAGAATAAALDRNPDFTNLLVSVDRKTCGILIEIVDRQGDDQYRADIIDALRGLMTELGGGAVELHLSGIAVQKHDVTDFVEHDQAVLIPLAILTLAVVLALFFRRLVGVILPLGVTGISVAWTLGAYHLAGLEVNAITALLPPILMVLSVTVSVHLVQGWVSSARRGADRIAAIRDVVRRLLFPCFFCSLTTGLGFASLAVSNMPAVQQFGVFAALGVFVSFVVAMTLIPVGLTFLTPPAAVAQRPSRTGRVLNWTADVAAERPGRVFGIFLAVTAVSVAAIPWIRNNTDLVRFLKRDAPLYRDTMFIDRHLTGTNAVEFVIARRDGGPLTSLDAVRRMAAFEKALLARPNVPAVMSALAVLRQVNRAESGSGELALPADQAELSYVFDLIEAAPEQPLVRKLLAPDFTHARMSVRLHTMGTAAAAPLVESMVADAGRIFGGDYSVTPTGAFYHVIQDSNRLVVAQVKSFALAMALVFLAIGLLFRSPRLTLISLIPNAAPILWTGGLMGAFGIDLSTGTAMIASAVLGLVVDDTIHYLTHYTRVYEGDAPQAVRHTTLGIGRALVMNNLVLVLGFWVGCFGSFKPTIYFSLLSGVTMISALVCDLLVTPACLMLFDKSGR